MTPIEVYESNIIGFGYSRSPTKKIFGIRWNKADKTTSLLTRLDNKIGSFDYEPIYRNIKVCNLVNGKVTAYKGEADFTTKPLLGDVMVEIPKYYYKIVDNTNARDIYISNEPDDGFLVSPRHSNLGGRTKDLDKIYVGAYTNNSSYRSISGSTSLVSQTRATHRKGCAARGPGYSQYDYATLWTIALLFLVEYANLDSQAALGLGYVDSATLKNPAISGTTDPLDSPSGYLGTNGQSAIKYRGIENLWGNLFQWCDGINTYDRDIYICTDPSKYTDDTSVGYIPLSYQKSSSSGYITDLGYDSKYPWAQFPTASQGDNYGPPIPDYIWQSNGWRILRTHGFYLNDTVAGLLFHYMSETSGTAHAYTTSRLIYLPEE